MEARPTDRPCDDRPWDVGAHAKARSPLADCSRAFRRDHRRRRGLARFRSRLVSAALLTAPPAPRILASWYPVRGAIQKCIAARMASRERRSKAAAVAPL